MRISNNDNVLKTYGVCAPYIKVPVMIRIELDIHHSQPHMHVLIRLSPLFYHSNDVLAFVFGMWVDVVKLLEQCLWIFTYTVAIQRVGHQMADCRSCTAYVYARDKDQLLCMPINMQLPSIFMLLPRIKGPPPVLDTHLP